MFRVVRSLGFPRSVSGSMTVFLQTLKTLKIKKARVAPRLVALLVECVFAQSVLSLTLPEKLSMVTRAPPEPVLNRSSFPGVYLSVLLGSGPMEFLMAPE